MAAWLLIPFALLLISGIPIAFCLLFAIFILPSIIFGVINKVAWGPKPLDYSLDELIT